MGRKADVAVARAKARAVGLMVAGWERLGDILVAVGEILVITVGNVCRRETDVVAEIRF